MTDEHYAYRPAFQEDDICPTCTQYPDLIVAWPCAVASDRLAEVLDKELTGTRFNEEDGSTSVYFNDGAHLARIAREYIAREIERDVDAANWNGVFRNGMFHAADIARRGTL